MKVYNVKKANAAQSIIMLAKELVSKIVLEIQFRAIAETQQRVYQRVGFQDILLLDFQLPVKINY